MGIEEHRLLLLRHGETEWSQCGRHTGRTDLELTEVGRRQAVAARATLAELALDNPLVICSPRRRTQISAELAGLHVDEISDDLAEWDYGRYEGLTTAQIRQTESDWLIWTHGSAGGETVAQVSDRADRMVAVALRQLASRDVVFVGHGHFSRAVIARWLELPLADGARFGMAVASLAVCGFEHGVRQLVALGLTGPKASGL
ncbi:acid phosphatase [Mycolicibacter heraklionensis]|uniref:Acid phosphatase n=1 Tax=Mycolicibacter heraklionensis TaxID=512402 RepID=A0A9X7WEB0_9MYCO|nr:acid phosphatase [Mycolicibacter heraklionensis]QZA06626.1 acid phosphatase [Mycolicibacter heraklionensis]